MLVLFRRAAPGTIILTIITAVVLWLGAFYRPLPASYLYGGVHMPLYDLLLQIADPVSARAVKASFLLVLLLSALLISVNTGLFFINRRTFLPAIIYLVVISLFQSFHSLHPALIASLFVLLALRRLIGLYRTGRSAQISFDSALLISAGSLFYVNAIWYALLLFIAMAVFRTFRARELIYAVAGLVTPYLLLSGIYFVGGDDISRGAMLFTDALISEQWAYQWSRINIVAGLFIAAALVVSILHLLSVLNTKKVRSRKVFILLLWLIIITPAIYMTVPSASEELVFFFAMGVSYMITHYLVFAGSRTVSEIIFTGMILLALVNQAMRFMPL